MFHSEFLGNVILRKNETCQKYVFRLQTILFIYFYFYHPFNLFKSKFETSL